MGERVSPISGDRLLLLAMFLEAEEMAVSGHETCTYPGSVFDDATWREGDGATHFGLLKRVRAALGLKPFRYRNRKEYGGAEREWAKFRAKELATIKRLKP